MRVLSCILIVHGIFFIGARFLLGMGRAHIQAGDTFAEGDRAGGQSWLPLFPPGSSQPKSRTVSPVYDAALDLRGHR